MAKLHATKSALVTLVLVVCVQASHATDKAASAGFADLLEACGTAKDARLEIAVISPFSNFEAPVNREDVARLSDFQMRLDVPALAEYLSQAIFDAKPVPGKTRHTLDLRYEFKCEWGDDGLLVFHADQFGHILHEDRVYVFDGSSDWLTSFFSGVLGSIVL